MIRVMLTAVALAATGAAVAKLPPLDDAAKSKAAETAAKAAWQAKLDTYKLCQVQDRVAAQYKGKAGAKPVAVPSGAVTQTSAAPAAAAAAPTAAPAAAAAAKPAAAPAAAAPAAAAASTPSNSGKPLTTAEGGGTPVPGVAAAPVIPPCSDPGPFAYAPPDQKPLETSGAHSPAPTASSPPSVKPNSAEMAPTKPGTAPPGGPGATNTPMTKKP